MSAAETVADAPCGTRGGAWRFLAVVLPAAGSLAARTPSSGSPGLSAALVTAFFVAFIEESLKFAAVYTGVYRNPECNEVLDGIVYGVAASLGFATLENIAYVLGGGVSVGVMRAILSVPGHAFFGALMGFYIGVAKCSNSRPAGWLARGLVLAIVAHTAYDAVLLSGTLLALAVFPLVLFLWWRAILHTRRALALDNERLAVRS